MQKGDEQVDFRNLIKKKDDKYDVAVTFSSVLELMKSNKLTAEQKKLFGDIFVKPTPHLYEEAGSDNPIDGGSN